MIAQKVLIGRESELAEWSGSLERLAGPDSIPYGGTFRGPDAAIR